MSIKDIVPPMVWRIAQKASPNRCGYILYGAMDSALRNAIGTFIRSVNHISI